MPLVFLTGGARSGKSQLAVHLASATSRPVTFVATATATDEDMEARIERHRNDRPPSWSLVEEPVDLVRPLVDAAPGDCLVVDCLTLWVSNLMAHGTNAPDIESLAEEAAGVALARDGHTIVVSNEVGSGVHAPTALGRSFADVLGRVNSTWARSAHEAYLCVAGRTLRLD